VLCRASTDGTLSYATGTQCKVRLQVKRGFIERIMLITSNGRLNDM